MKRLWLTGYRSYELGVFGDSDEKLKVIKYSLKKQLNNYLDDGLEWLITGGQMGIEQWGIQVAQELKIDYPELKVAMMLPFSDFGQQWNEQNQGTLMTLKAQVDFCEPVIKAPYSGPQQLRQYQQFMLTHTDGALLYYDREAPGKPEYDAKAIETYQEQHEYPNNQVDFFELQDLVNELAELENQAF
ncbi:DUF1273 domain-containing protein [Latilactobacillus sakei]|uniref:DUF1273 domain-containing protein n=1 Tax=Latilactobacillus sakei TaxID=1599 RepID=UPI00232AEA3A|nr:DUF1273 domain-containing protein [Latilactobacillus sakei]MDB1552862.1 DUF1273 domain-containing protein [Latilactobacillus sakei]